MIQAVTPPAEMSYAISFMMLGQLGGIAFGLAISGAVFVNDAIANLTALLPSVSREQLQLAISGTSGAYLRSLSPEMRAAAMDAVVAALRKVFIPVYVAAAFSLVLSVAFTVSYPLLLITYRCWIVGTALIGILDISNGKCSRISWPSRRERLQCAYLQAGGNVYSVKSGGDHLSRWAR